MSEYVGSQLADNESNSRKIKDAEKRAGKRFEVKKKRKKRRKKRMVDI